MARLRSVIGMGVGLLLAADIAMQIKAGGTGDKNWLLLAARMWLEGRPIGSGIFEVNPPLILWLYAIPARMAQLLPLTDYQALAILGLACTGLSIWLCMRLTAIHPFFTGDKRKQANFVLLFVAVLLFFQSPVYFFDRDHIMFALTFPYMLRFMPSLAHQRIPFFLRMIIAACAALGFCIKPHGILLFAALEGIWILRERSPAILWCMENLVIYGAGMAYLLCVWRFAPDYLTVILPMAAETYSGFSHRFNGIFFLSMAFFSAGLIFADFRYRFVTPYRKDTFYFLAVSIGYLAYALFNNGWGYAYNPLLCMLLFMSGWMLFEYGWLADTHQMQGLPVKRFLSGRRGCIINLALNTGYVIFWLTAFFFTAECSDYRECRQTRDYIAYVRDTHVHSFSTLSTNLQRWTSIAQATGAVWESRFNSLWMLPGLLTQAPPQPWIRGYVGNALAEDLERRKPDIVFVDTSDRILGYPHPVDIPAFFGTIAAFKTAWTHYRYFSSIDHCKNAWNIDCRYAVYRRTP